MAGERIELGRGTWDAALREPSRESVNVGNISSNRLEADVHADTQIILDAYKAELTAIGYQPTVLNTVADPVNPPDDTPTPDEITAAAELRTAFNTIMQQETDDLWTRIETEYNNIRTTTEPFFKYTELKHLRQRSS